MSACAACIVAAVAVDDAEFVAPASGLRLLIADPGTGIGRWWIFLGAVPTFSARIVAAVIGRDAELVAPASCGGLVVAVSGA